MSALFGLTRVHLCIVLLLILIVPYVDANISDILLEQKKAVVTVYVNDENGKHIASGGGFIIDPNGVIVTNCQVQLLKNIQSSKTLIKNVQIFCLN
jgi:hypothetical protein